MNLREGISAREGNLTPREPRSQPSPRRWVHATRGSRVTPLASGLTPRRSRGGSAGTRAPGRAAARRGAPRRGQGQRSRTRCSRSPVALDEAELAEIRVHPVEGAWLIAGVPAPRAALPIRALPPRALGRRAAIRRGASGTEIPIEGRIARRRRRVRRDDARPAVPRCARLRLGDLGEVERCAGTQFDPEIAAAFCRRAFEAGEIRIDEPCASDLGRSCVP